MVQRSVRGTEAGFSHGLSTNCFYADDEPPTRTPPDRSIYVGLSEHEMGWNPVMLRGISRGEVEHLKECGRASTGSQLSAAN